MIFLEYYLSLQGENTMHAWVFDSRTESFLREPEKEGGGREKPQLDSRVLLKIHG